MDGAGNVTITTTGVSTSIITTAATGFVVLVLVGGSLVGIRIFAFGARVGDLNFEECRGGYPFLAIRTRAPQEQF